VQQSLRTDVEAVDSEAHAHWLWCRFTILASRDAYNGISHP